MRRLTVMLVATMLLSEFTANLPKREHKAQLVQHTAVAESRAEYLHVGFWFAQWNMEHAAMELYRLLRAQVSVGELEQLVEELIHEQQQQITLIHQLYTSLVPGATELTTPQIRPEIPPRDEDWVAHTPPMAQEIAWSALYVERRALLGYESIAAVLTREPLPTQDLLRIQQQQIEALSRLFGQPPRTENGGTSPSW